MKVRERLKELGFPWELGEPETRPDGFPFFAESEVIITSSEIGTTSVTGPGTEDAFLHLDGNPTSPDVLMPSKAFAEKLSNRFSEQLARTPITFEQLGNLDIDF